MLDPARLVFIDETAVSTNMVRLRGRAPRGTRVIGTVPLGAWETITFVGALRHNKMTAPMVIEGAMTGEMFLAYVEQCLVPTLRRNDIVVMDNCRVHLVAGIREAIEKARATLRYFAESCRANCSWALPSNSLVRTTARCSGMRQLLQACGLCFNMTGNRFSPDKTQAGDG